ncbi:MAG: hypothetical protein CL677_10745 [Bdellovibrionaceae bacterium]|nr:hypothetical protein [Pseudobdellovibrionaceae bacterium]|tara:strand:+ start:29129 stop:29755 length:627 start_codon:yes stop_codon:yes gene_type:complete
MNIQLDHIVWAHPHLELGNQNFSEQTGVTPRLGGQHLDLGTHNSLVSLGSDSYLELISPDPTNKVPGGVQVLGIGEVTQPKIVGWAISVPLQEIQQKLRQSGFAVSEIGSGSRRTPENIKLKWNYIFLEEPEFNETPQIAPFFIQWLGENPAHNSPRGCTLDNFWAEHPHPDRFRKLFDTLDFPMQIDQGPTPQLRAVVTSDKNSIEI